MSDLLFERHGGMDQEQPFSLPGRALKVTIEFVKDKHGIFLHEGNLVVFYEKILVHRKDMAKRIKEDPSLAGSDSFDAAMIYVLDQHLTQNDEREQQIYEAHKCGMGKLAAQLKALRKKRAAPKTHTPLERLKGRVVYDPEKPQSRFAF